MTTENSVKQIIQNRIDELEKELEAELDLIDKITKWIEEKKDDEADG